MTDEINVYDTNDPNLLGNDVIRDEADDANDRGYGKPPKEHQFKPGQSGNPKGRARGSRGLKTDLGAELRSRVTITENGKTRRATKQQVMLKSLVAKAAKGDSKAAAQVLAMTMQMFGIEDERHGKAVLTPNQQAILDNYMKGGALGVPAAPPSEVEPDTEPEPVPATDGAGNSNHNNNGTDVCVPDEEFE